MTKEMVARLLARLNSLEQRGTSLRTAAITNTDPLTISLGGSEVPSAGAGSLGPETLRVGQVVSVLITGNGRPVVVGSVAAGAGTPGSIEGAAIATGAVTRPKIAALAVGDAQIEGLTAGKITGPITAEQIGSINASQITGSITAGQIASVAATQITGSLTAAQIASVNASAISGTITSAQIGSVNAGSVVVGADGLAAISTNLGSITAGAITGATITGGTIQTAASGSRVVMTSAGIVGYGTDGTTPTFVFDTATGTITALAGTSIVGGASGGGQIAPATIGGTDLVVGAVTAGKIAAGAVSAGTLAVGAVTAGTVAAGVITASELSATAIDGKTITGALIRTAAAGARVELSGVAPVGIKKYDAAGNVAVSIGQTDGLEVLAGISATPPADRRVSWKRAAGTKVADLVGFDDGAGQSALYASITNAAGLTWSRYVLREDGKSGFLQLPVPKQAAVLWGRVLATGATSEAGSGMWTAVLYGTAPDWYYVVYPDPALSMTEVCATVTSEAAVGGMTTVVTPYAGQAYFAVQFQYSWNPNYYITAPFSFVVHGLTAIAGAVT